MLNVLVRITPPVPEVHFPRVPLNIALVIDRSGSMAEGKKMRYARDAAAFAVRQLLPTDRVSVTVFDEEVSTIVQGTLATDKSGVVRAIEAVQPRGSTDLHGGWTEGGRQAQAGLVSGGVNRVLLLSDGLANAGVVDPNTIAVAARKLAAQGVSTTTMGVGDHYNEDLMEAMARAGDGHYYYIESPAQLTDIFQTELKGLMDLLGQKVSLGLEPRGSVVVADVLNDFEKVSTGRLMLPNLILGMPVHVVLQLKLPPLATGTELLEIRLAWDAPRDRGRRVMRASLGGLRAVPEAEWLTMPEDPKVAEQVALMMVARAQQEAAKALERGDFEGTARFLGDAKACFAPLPASPALLAEQAALNDMEAALHAGQNELFTKGAKFRAYRRRNARIDNPPEPPAGNS